MAMALLTLFLSFSACEAGFLKAKFFKPVKHHPKLQVAENVCLQIKEPCGRMIEDELDDEGNNFMSKKLHLQAIPQDYKGELVQTALLMTKAKRAIIDHKQTAFARTADEWSEAMLPVFDAVHDLKQKMEQAGTTEGLFSAVLMPQVPQALKFHANGSFDGDVFDSLLETSGSTNKAKKLFCEDIKKEQTMCFAKLMLYRHKEREQLSTAAIDALRTHTAVEGKKASGRKAVLLLNHMSWANRVEVGRKLRGLLAEKCWDFENLQVEHTDASVQSAIDNLKDADLVIANHGIHNENMIWMPKNAAFIEDKNCKCSDYGYKALAEQQGLQYVNTYGLTGDDAQCTMQHKGQGVCAADKPRMVDFDTEIRPVVSNLIDELEKHRTNVPFSGACKEM